MKKIYKISKRLVAMFVILLICTNSYATSASFDGNAFVTKAEFDSLVANFNEQMNVYQTGVNAKIDNAVASYIGGLSTETYIDQDMLINNFSDKYKFTNEWKLWSGTDDCQLGDKINWTTSICVFGFGAATTGPGSYIIEWTVTNNNQTSGSTTSNYVLVSKSNYNSNKYTIAGRMKSFMKSSAIGTWTRGNIWSNTGTPGSLQPTDLYDTTNSEYFGSNNMTLAGNIFGSSVSMTTTVSYSNDDTIESDLAMKDYVSGNKVPTGKTLYLVVDTEINKKKNNKRDIKGYGSSGYCKSKNGGDTKYAQNNSRASDYKVTGYYHDYKEVASSTGYQTFLIDAVSSAADMDTTYYNGLPLFKASNNGVAYLEFTLTGNEGTTHTFEIKGEQFGNAAITGGITGLSNSEYSYTDEQGNVIKNVPEIPTGRTVSAKFDCVKDKVYWIKVNPSAGVTTVRANSIKIGNAG